MVASSKSAEDQLAALRADLAAQMSVNKKMSGQVKEKDARIRALEAELESLRTANGARCFIICTYCGYKCMMRDNLCVVSPPLLAIVVANESNQSMTV